MKGLVGCASMFMFGILAGSAAGAQSESMPVRRSGLWELRYKSPERWPARPDKFCSSATIEKKDPGMAFGTPMNWMAVCEKPVSIQHKDGLLAFKAACRMSAKDRATTYTEGTASGDFSGSYHADFEVRMVSFTKAVTMDHHFVIDGKWIGRCPADMRPGDLVSWSGHRTYVGP
jgi:hypothetical protein